MGRGKGEGDTLNLFHLSLTRSRGLPARKSGLESAARVVSGDSHGFPLQIITLFLDLKTM